jgi:hypothetical protein
LRTPVVSSSRSQAEAIQRSRDRLIAKLAQHLSDHFDGINAVLASSVLLDSKLKMATTRPMNQQHDLALLIIHIGTISLTKIRTILCFRRISAVGAFHTPGRSWARLSKTSLWESPGYLIDGHNHTSDPLAPGPFEERHSTLFPVR